MKKTESKDATPKKKKSRKGGIIIGIIVLALLAIILVKIFKKPGKISDFENYAVTVDQIELPEGTRIVALGEATHGNKEFQELKLEVFKHLVLTSNVRALVLEGEIGGCAIVNDYIQGGEGDPDELINHLGYGIYRTDQMRELIVWMHDYNETAAEDDKVRLYGMDIQDDVDNIAYINSFYSKVDPAKGEDFESRMTELLGDDWDTYDTSRLDEIDALVSEIEKDIEDNKDAYIEKTNLADVEMADRVAYAIKVHVDYYEKDGATNDARDSYMKENVDWVLGIEEGEHDSAVMIASHNGHMSQIMSATYNSLGILLNEEYGDSYFAIGTDFYITNDNLPNGSNRERTTVEFCSDDPVAYQVKNMPEDKYYIDFSKVDSNSALGQKVNNVMPTGSLGEGYSVIMKFIKRTHQIKFVPSEMYDAMIVFYEVSPTEIYLD